MIHLESVGKVYQTANGPVHALRSVDLDVAEGQCVAVRGPSGSGKSTLLHIVGGLGTPTAGRVRVSGEDLPAMPAAARARFRAERVGFVFQTFHLLPYLTIWDNVAVASVRGGAAAARQQARRLLEQFNLGHRLHHRPAELSTGECQRAAIARALVNGPRLILADEPTGNLDPDNAATVWHILAEFHRQGGTVLLVTHEQEAAGIAQRTVWLRDGAIQNGAAGQNLAEMAGDR